MLLVCCRLTGGNTEGYLLRLRQFPAIVKSLLFIAARLAQHFIDLRLVNRAGDAVAQNRNFIPQRTQHFAGGKYRRADDGVDGKGRRPPTVAEISGATTACRSSWRRTRSTDPFIAISASRPSTSVSSVCSTPSLIHAVLLIESK